MTKYTVAITETIEYLVPVDVANEEIAEQTGLEIIISSADRDKYVVDCRVRECEGVNEGWDAQDEALANPAPSTPSPWTIKVTEFAGAQAIMVDPVAIVLGHGQTAEANARLIAAAPQMLALLQTIARMDPYSIDSSDDQLEDAVSTMNSLIHSARALI